MPDVVFATADDVAVRLGRELTDEQVALAESVIDTVQGLILETVNKDQTWADDLDPIPALFEVLCVEKAIALIANPIPTIASETVGAVETTWTRGSDAGIFLTDEEKRRVRRAVRLSSQRSVTLESPYSGDDDEVSITDDLVL